MPKYIVSAIDDNGHKVIEEVTALRPIEAIQTFRDDGYDNVCLETDDVVAIVKDELAKLPRDDAKFYTLSAEEQIRLAKLGRAGKFAFLSHKFLLRSLHWYMIVCGIFVARPFFGIPFYFWDVVPITIILLPFLAAFWNSLFSPMYRLIEEISWCRWGNALDQLANLQEKLPPFELAVYKAGALAGLGQLDKGLALLEPYSVRQDVPRWMYWARLSGIFMAGGDHEESIECLKKGLDLAPNTPALQIELANAEIRFHRNSRAARAILNQVNMSVVTEMMLPHLETTYGLLALDDGSTSTAIEHFQRALTIATRFAASNPLAAANADKIRGYLALSYALCGDMEEARRHYKKAERRIRCNQLADLRDRCEKALGRYVD